MRRAASRLPTADGGSPRRQRARCDSDVRTRRGLRRRRDKLVELAHPLPRKVLRWIAAHHPDNRTRLLFYELTGVPIGEGTVINPQVLIYDEYRGLVSFGERVSVASGVAFVAASVSCSNQRRPDAPRAAFA